MRHDPIAMGYLTASIAVPTFSPSRCYDRGDAFTINVSPSRTRAHFMLSLQAAGFDFMFCDIFSFIQATCSVCTHTDNLRHSIAHSNSALPFHCPQQQRPAISLPTATAPCHCMPRAETAQIINVQELYVYKIIPTTPLDELSAMLPHINVADIKV
jgi:hypothetical protein